MLESGITKKNNVPGENEDDLDFNPKEFERDFDIASRMFNPEVSFEDAERGVRQEHLVDDLMEKYPDLSTDDAELIAKMMISEGLNEEDAFNKLIDSKKTP